MTTEREIERMRELGELFPDIPTEDDGEDGWARYDAQTVIERQQADAWAGTACPVCGHRMRIFRHGSRGGHCFPRHDATYICPVDESETTTNERGHLVRSPDATHPRARRIWHEWELTA